MTRIRASKRAKDGRLVPVSADDGADEGEHGEDGEDTKSGLGVKGGCALPTASLAASSSLDGAAARRSKPHYHAKVVIIVCGVHLGHPSHQSAHPRTRSGWPAGSQQQC